MQGIRYAVIGGLVGLGILVGACSGSTEEIKVPKYSIQDIISVAGIYDLPEQKYITDYYIIRSYDRNHDGQSDVYEYRHLRSGVITAGANLPHEICFAEDSVPNRLDCYIDSDLDGSVDTKVPAIHMYAVNADYKVAPTNTILVIP